MLEALSQRKRSHYGYVVWHLPEPSLVPDKYEQVRKYAADHGIGLIILKRIEQSDGRLSVADHEIVLFAERHEPDPVQAETLIENHLTLAAKKAVLRWYTASEG